MLDHGGGKGVPGRRNICEHTEYTACWRNEASVNVGTGQI